MNTQEILTLGGIAGAFLAIGRLFFMVRSGGAEKQEMVDDIKWLKDEAEKNRAFRKEMYSRMDEIKQLINDMRLESSQSHAAIEKRIAVLEVSGCSPAKK